MDQSTASERYVIWDSLYQAAGVSTRLKVSNQSTDQENSIGADAAIMEGP